MTERMRLAGTTLMMSGLALAAWAVLVLLVGCGKQQPTAQQPAQQAQAVPAAAPAPTVATAEQTTCPVMGGAINKAIFVEYQGKKVYFCCAGCPEAFQADPQKYLAKLPQFQK